MKTHFIFDRKQKEQQDIIAEILSLAKKKPYPNKDVTHLATFMESCFYVIEQENLAKLARKKSEIKRELNNILIDSELDISENVQKIYNPKKSKKDTFYSLDLLLLL